MALALRRVAPLVTRPLAVAVPVRLPHTFNDRERAAEAAYFNREEEKLLRKLLGKVRKDLDTADSTAASAASKPAASATSVERQKLEAIIGKYKVSEGDIKALLAWRHAFEY